MIHDTKLLPPASNEILEADMIHCQTKHLKNSDYLKTLTALIKVYEQYARIFGYGDPATNEVKKEIAKQM